MKYSIIKNKGIRSLLFVFFTLSAFATASYGDGAYFVSTPPARMWAPIIAIGGGFFYSSKIGESQNFPIVNPVTDEFFNYSANSNKQKADIFEGFIGAEFKVKPQISIQVGLDYLQTLPLTAKGTLVQGADAESADTFAYQYGVSTKQLLAEGKLLFNVQCFHPYLLAGAGFDFYNAHNYYTNVPPFLTFTRMYSNNGNSSFSYALGFGVDIDSINHVRIGLGYRFTDLGSLSLGSATINGINVSGTLSQNHLYANEVLARLTFII